MRGKEERETASETGSRETYDRKDKGRTSGEGSETLIADKQRQTAYRKESSKEKERHKGLKEKTGKTREGQTRDRKNKTGHTERRQTQGKDKTPHMNVRRHNGHKTGHPRD